MKTLQTSYMGLSLANPLIAGSSGFTSNIDSIKILEDNNIGAVVLKSLFEEQINFEAGQLESYDDHPDAAAYIHAYSKSNSLQKYLDLIVQAKKAVKIPVIASISCLSSGDWVNFAKQIAQAGADALEVNMFLLPIDKNRSGASYEEPYIQVLDALKAHIDIPIAMKIGHYFSNPMEMVKRMAHHKADAVVLFNHFYEPDIDIEALNMIPAEALSSSSDLRLSLRWISLVSAQLPDVQLSASTGIHDGKDVIKQLLAGAQTTQLCSTLYLNGAGQIGKILAFMQDWMIHHCFTSINEFRGKMNYRNIAQPDIYERSQFMKYYSNRK